jgi:CBS domain-containing protein
MELSRNLKVDSVARLNPTPPHEIDALQSIQSTIDLMRREKVGCLLIVRDSKLVGIFTDRDFLSRVLAVGRPLEGPIAEVMTPDPITVEPQDSIRTAIKRMQSGNYRHLPVVDSGNHPVGILSVKRIVHYLVEHFPSTVYNQSPDPKKVPETPEGA